MECSRCEEMSRDLARLQGEMLGLTEMLYSTIDVLMEIANKVGYDYGSDDFIGKIS